MRIATVLPLIVLLTAAVSGAVPVEVPSERNELPGAGPEFDRLLEIIEGNDSFLCTGLVLHRSEVAGGLHGLDWLSPEPDEELLPG